MVVASASRAGLASASAPYSAHTRVNPSAHRTVEVEHTCRWRCSVPRLTLFCMERRAHWIARAWLPYFLAGLGWLVAGALVLGDPKGLGLIFIGLACLALGAYGAVWRLLRGYGLVRRLP